jgi:hypothetical protein
LKLASTIINSLYSLRSDGKSGNVFEALQYAARMGFRAGVVKTFVLVTCDEGAMTSSEYGDSMTMLTEQEITLHLLAPMDLHFKGSSRSRLASKLYGFSKQSVITASGSDQDLRRQLKNPKDHLSTLAQESGGTVFNLNKLATRKRSTAKKASSVISQEVARLCQPSECQVCDCLANADGQGRLMCHKCILPSIDIVLQNWEQYGPNWLD